MSETIKASEITPGMEIEYMHNGFTTRVTASGYNTTWVHLYSAAGGLASLGRDEIVTVLSRPATIIEPKSLGARVKDGDRLFLRARNSVCAWLEVTDGKAGGLHPWSVVNEFGTAVVVDGDPSWEVETGDDENLGQWDNVEEALEHCDRVIDRDGDPWYYVDGDLHFTTFGKVTRWSHSTKAANDSGPFRRS